MSPEGAALLCKASIGKSVAPSTLNHCVQPAPGLTAGPTHCRPFGPGPWKIRVSRQKLEAIGANKVHNSVKFASGTVARASRPWKVGI